MQFHDTWVQNPEVNLRWLQNCGDVTALVACCVRPIFSSISSPGMMDLQNEVLVFWQSDHSSASAPRRCNLCGAKLQPLGWKHLRRRVVGKEIWWRCRAGEFLWSCWGRLRMSVVIAVPWICFWGLERHRIDILDILASGVPADFRQPSRSAFQPQVRSMSGITSLSPVEALRWWTLGHNRMEVAHGFGVWLTVVWILSVCGEK